MKEISSIVAIAQDHGIGKDNQLLYWLPNDLKRFKALTTGNTIIMGRKTFESLPKGALPNRRNVVLSRQQGLTFEGAEIFPSLEEALKHCGADEKVFIIGGASVYQEAMPFCTHLHITEIADNSKEADAFFPTISKDEWEEIGREEHGTDEKHAYAYAFVDYKRK